VKPGSVIIVLLYSVVFYPDSTSTPISAFIYFATLSGNIIGLLFAASSGIIVNHMVRIVGIHLPVYAGRRESAALHFLSLCYQTRDLPAGQTDPTISTSQVGS